MARNGLLHRIWNNRIVYLFISPFYILFLIFGLFPILWSFYLTFHEWNGLSPMTPVGLGNYAALLRDTTFHEALMNTTIYWIVDIVFTLSLALILASLLHNAWLRGGKAFKVTLFLPYVTATVAVGLVFNMIFDFNSGLINAILKEHQPDASTVAEQHRAFKDTGHGAECLASDALVHADHLLRPPGH